MATRDLIDLNDGGIYDVLIGNVRIGDSDKNSYRFPDSDGIEGQVMVTDGSGQLRWIDHNIDSDLIVQTIRELFNIQDVIDSITIIDSEAVVEIVDGYEFGADSDWVLRQIPNINGLITQNFADTRYIPRSATLFTINGEAVTFQETVNIETGSDVTNITNTTNNIMNGADSDWVLEQIPDVGPDSDWVLDQINAIEIPSIDGLASTSYVDNSIAAIVIPEPGADSDWVLRQIPEIPEVGPDSDWVLRQIPEIPEVGPDSDWVLGQIPDVGPDSDWVLGQIPEVGPDSDWVLEQIPDPIEPGADSDWVLRQIPDPIEPGADSDWVLRQIPQGPDSDWVLDQITGPDSDWVLGQIPDPIEPGADSDWVLDQIPDPIEPGADSDWVLRQIPDPIEPGADSDWVLRQIPSAAELLDSDEVNAVITDRLAAFNDSELIRDTVTSDYIYERIDLVDSDWILRQIPEVGPDSDWVLEQIPDPIEPGADSDWVLRQIPEVGPDSDWVLEQIPDVGPDSDWVLSQIPEVGPDSDWVLRQIPEVGPDSDWVLDQITGPDSDWVLDQITGTDSDWVLRQIPQGPDSDWVLDQITGPDSDWVLDQIPQGPDSDWVLRQIPEVGPDSDWVLEQIPDVGPDSDWVLRQIPEVGPDSDWVLEQIPDVGPDSDWVNERITNIDLLDSDQVVLDAFSYIYNPNWGIAGGGNQNAYIHVYDGRGNRISTPMAYTFPGGFGQSAATKFQNFANAFMSDPRDFGLDSEYVDFDNTTYGFRQAGDVPQLNFGTLSGGNVLQFRFTRPDFRMSFSTDAEDNNPYPTGLFNGLRQLDRHVVAARPWDWRSVVDANYIGNNLPDDVVRGAGESTFSVTIDTNNATDAYTFDRSQTRAVHMFISARNADGSGVYYLEYVITAPDGANPSGDVRDNIVGNASLISGVSFNVVGDNVTVRFTRNLGVGVVTANVKAIAL